MDFSKTAGLVQACHGAAAKAGKDGDQSYLPLWMHTADTAGVMEKLFEYRLSGQEKRLFIQAAGSEDEARKFFLLCGFLHDFGKMTAAFQTVMKTALGDSDRFEFPLPDHPLVQKYPHQHHTAAGLVILCSIGVPEWIASIAGAHHGKTQMSVGRDEQKILRREKPVFFGRPEDKKIWVDAWKQMLKAVLEICEIDSISSFSKFPVNLLLLLSGYVVEADWIASNTEYFPLIPTENSGDPKMYPGRIDEGWKKLSFTRPWDTQPHKMTEEIFVKMFGFSPNGFQIAMIDVLNHVEKPGLFLVEAPMGLGKTEAALTAADSLAGRFQSGGIFFGLPTQATANGLFSRFADWAEKEAGEQQQTLKLAHGSAAFNPEYQQIRGEASSVDVDGDKNQQGRLIVHEWMSD